MDCVITPDSIRTFIEDALPSATVDSVSPCSSRRLQKLYTINLSDGRLLKLSLTPQSQGLLRFEQWATTFEGVVIQSLRQIMVDGSKEFRKTTSNLRISYPDEADRDLARCSSSHVCGRDHVFHSSSTSIPMIIKYSPNTTELGSPFTLLEQIGGIPLVDFSTSLKTNEQEAVAFQKGRFMRRISQITSPNGGFGLAAVVFSSAQRFPDFRDREDLGIYEVTTSWKRAFHSLLEAVLRDAEDFSVTISYELIRRHFDRLGHVLDAITVPRLVVVDGGDDGNVLISRSDASHQEKGPGDVGGQRTRPAEQSHTSQHKSIAEDETPTNPPGYSITGLNSWTNSMFGDPLFANIFTQDHKPGFLHGFRQPSSPTPGENISSDKDKHPYGDLIEDPTNAPLRLLLYEMYHAIVALIQLYYRPEGTSSNERDIAARRRLAVVLGKLDAVYDEAAAGKRPSALDAVTSPAKRARSRSPR
ncbi:hypothetical protein F4780DRAFT_783794 [Xylariomycetidae sp. FL0641]|nr:hypothetical protein F4780DRAFT_783794 [Xylariomycetidae sp. FL0641]